jgi:hypothetical protein
MSNPPKNPDAHAVTALDRLSACTSASGVAKGGRQKNAVSRGFHASVNWQQAGFAGGRQFLAGSCHVWGATSVRLAARCSIRQRWRWWGKPCRRRHAIDPRRSLPCAGCSQGPDHRDPERDALCAAVRFAIEQIAEARAPPAPIASG